MTPIIDKDLSTPTGVKIDVAPWHVTLTELFRLLNKIADAVSPKSAEKVVELASRFLLGGSHARCVNRNPFTTLGTTDSAILLEPSDELLRFVAALRALDRDLDIVAHRHLHILG